MHLNAIKCQYMEIPFNMIKSFVNHLLVAIEMQKNAFTFTSVR